MEFTDVVRKQRELLQSDLVIISDSPVDVSGRSRILFGVRGVLSFELQARGANRDLHSGNWGGVVPNPLWTLVHLLGTMKNERGEVTIDGFYQVKHDSQSQVKMGTGTLYGSLKRMLADGLIEEAGDKPDPTHADERRRYYRLTELGRRAFTTELQRYTNVVSIARKRSLLPNFSVEPG